MIHFFWRLYLRLSNPTCKIDAARVARNVSFEKNVSLGYGSIICAQSIGKYTYLNSYCLVDKNVRSIGRFTSIAYNCRIGLGGHPTDWVSSHAFAYKQSYGFTNGNVSTPVDESIDTIIGNDVWIGANCTILAGVTIGDGAIVGAHSLVREDVAPYSIVVGSPAKHLRYRFDEKVIAQLQEMQWWNWDDAKIKQHIHLFDDPEKLLAELS